MASEWVVCAHACVVLQYTEQNKIDAWGCLAGGDEVETPKKWS